MSEHLESLVGLGSLNEGNQIADQLGPQRFMGGAAISANRTAPFFARMAVKKCKHGDGCGAKFVTT